MQDKKEFYGILKPSLFTAIYEVDKTWPSRDNFGNVTTNHSLLQPRAQTLKQRTMGCIQQFRVWRSQANTTFRIGSGT